MDIVSQDTQGELKIGIMEIYGLTLTTFSAPDFAFKAVITDMIRVTVYRKCVTVQLTRSNKWTRCR